MSAIGGHSPTIGPDGFAQAQEALRPDTHSTQLQPYSSFRAIPQSSESKIARFFFGSGIGENTNDEKKYYVDHLDRQIKQLPASNYKTTLTVFRNAMADETDIGKIRNMLPEQNLTHLKHAAQNKYSYETLSSTVERLKQPLKALWNNIKGAFIGFSEVKNDIAKLLGHVKRDVPNPNQVLGKVRRATSFTIAPAKVANKEALLNPKLPARERIALYKKDLLDQVKDLPMPQAYKEGAAHIISEFKEVGNPHQFAEALMAKVKDMFPSFKPIDPDIQYRRDFVTNKLKEMVESSKDNLSEASYTSAMDFLNEASKLKDNTTAEDINNGLNNILNENFEGFEMQFLANQIPY